MTADEHAALVALALAQRPSHLDWTPEYIDAVSPAALLKAFEGLGTVRCSWCDTARPIESDEDRFAGIIEHTKTCPKSPLAAAVQTLRGLYRAIQRTLLRESELGEEMNAAVWDAFQVAMSQANAYLNMVGMDSMPIPADVATVTADRDRLAAEVDHLREELTALKSGAPVKVLSFDAERGMSARNVLTRALELAFDATEVEVVQTLAARLDELAKATSDRDEALAELAIWRTLEPADPTGEGIEPTEAVVAEIARCIERSGDADVLAAQLVDATRLCDKVGCTAAVIRRDDGSRRCAAGHASRWIDVADAEHHVTKRPATAVQPAPVGDGREVFEVAYREFYRANSHERWIDQQRTDQILSDMRARYKLGIERYGTPLREHNGRDAVIDAYQEAIDLRMYLEQIRMEETADFRIIDAINLTDMLLEQLRKHLDERR